MNRLLSLFTVHRRQILVLPVAVFFLAGKLAAQAPTISSVAPLSAAPGSSVVITGTGFNTVAGNNIVRFGTVTALVTAASATSLTVTVPQNAAYGMISVLNRGNTLAASSLSYFRPAFAPNKTTLSATDFTREDDFITITLGILARMKTGDLDGDGKPEILVAPSSDDLRIFPNTSLPGGAITLGTAKIIPSTGIFSVADIDGNGWLDIVGYSPGLSSALVYLNSGTGDINTAFTGSFSIGYNVRPFAIGDLDGDGKPDMVTTNPNGPQLMVLRNTSTGIGAVSFTAQQEYQFSPTEGNPSDAILADIDNDGKLDIITGWSGNYFFANVSRMIFLLRNTSTPGNISFAPAEEFIDGPWASSRFIDGDLNNDGLADFVTGGGPYGSVGLGAFTKLSAGGAMTNFSTTHMDVLSRTLGLGLGDLNGDGKVDLLGGTFGASVFTHIYPNTSTGTNTSFGTRIDLPGVSSSAQMVVTDMNADGKPDIVMGLFPNGILAYRNILIAPPVTQATGITVTSLTGTTATLSWTNGSGSRRAVFIKQENTGEPAPVAETEYIANTALGSGAEISGTGWYCVYNGTGTTVSVTGLAVSTDYRVMVTEYDDGGLSNTAQYNTNTATGNAITLATQSTVNAISRTTAPAVINTAVADFSVIFHAAMTGLTPSNFSLTTSGVTGASVTAVSGSGTSFTVTVNTGSGDGTIGLNLANTTAVVPGVITPLPYTGEVYTIDKTAPTLSPVTIVSDNANTARAKPGDIITIGFTASETIATPAVTIAGSTATVTNTGGDGWTAAYTMTNTAADGIVPFSIAFTDAAGNAGTTVTATTNSSSVVFDKTIPTLNHAAIASNNTNTSRAKAGDVITLSFTSTETINTAVVNIMGNAVTPTNTGGNDWTATYTMTSGDAEGAISFSIAFSDLFGNAGTTVTATTNSSSVVFDKTIPTLNHAAIASNNTNTSRAKVGDVITLSFTASEAITAPAVNIAGSAATVINTAGNAWTVSYTMAGSDAEGAVTFNIAFSDISGNAGTTVTATTNSSSVVFDKTIPTLNNAAIASNNTNTSRAKVGDVITLNFTAGENISVPAVTISGNVVTAINTAGNNWTASYTMTNSDAEGNISFSIAFSDISGNAGTTVTATTNSSSVVFDKTIPTLNNVTIVSSNANTVRAKTGDVITLNFTTSENIPAPALIISGNVVAAMNTAGNAWTASYTMTNSDAEGAVAFSIAFSDITGNAGTTISSTTNSSSVVFDKTLPVLTDVSITSGNIHPAWAKKADVITLTFVSSETIITPTVTLATHAVAVSNTGSNNWIASYTMTDGDTEGTVPFSIAFADLTSNTGIAVTGTTGNTTVVYDITAPVLQPVTISSGNAIAGFVMPGNNVTLTMTTNETILSPTVTIASHSVAAAANTGNAWSAAYTMMASDTEGPVPFSITAVDMAGNTTVVSTTTDNSTVNFRRSEGPFFTNGTSQLLTVCQDINTAINNLLAVTYVQTGKPLTITVTGMPSHGTLSGFDAVLVSNGSTVLPSGLGYQPATGYAGADVFTAMVTDGTFTSTTTINVTVSTTPSGSITATGGTALCEGATLVLTGTGGNSYKWYQDGMLINNNSTSQLTVTETGVYTAILVSATGCEAAAAGTVTVTLIRKPQVDFTIGSNSCINIPVPFTNTSAWTGSGAVNHLWNDGKGGTSTAISPSFTYTQTGSYSVKLTITPQLCPALADSITKTVTITQALSGIRNPTMDIAKNEPTKLVIRTIPNASYQWTPARFLLTTNIPDPVTIASAEQEYQVALTLPSGCTTVDTLLVRLHENTTAYVPNVFSPNGDGQNDRLMPNLVGLKQLNFFRVFNKWGKMLFETTNMGQGWDGKYNGVLQPLDTYTWSIQGYDANGNMIKRQGSVTLLK